MAYINVVIPVYNAVSYLRDAVKSVLEQPFQDVNVILVDDGSTDGSSRLCDELAINDQRVYAIHENNRGVSAARNAGIKHLLKYNNRGGTSLFWIRTICGIRAF